MSNKEDNQFNTKSDSQDVQINIETDNTEGNDYMRKRSKRISALLRYGIVSAIGLVVVFAFAWANGIFDADETYVVLRILCDAFTVVGVLIAGAGALTLMKNAGAFDAIGYGFKSIGVMFTPVKIRKDRETYYDYMQRNKGKKSEVGFLLITGGVFLLIGIVILVVYGRYAPEIDYNAIGTLGTLYSV